MSYNNRFFICITLPNKYGIDNPRCYINNYSFSDLEEINCEYNHERNYKSEYKVFYFNKTGDFMFISRFLLKATTYNNFNNTIIKCNQKILDEQNEDYSIIL